MPRLSQLLVSRDRQFFDLFEEAASNILRAADLLDQMLRGYPENAALARDILICEQEGDRITHDVIRRLNEMFVTPIDREDIYALASTRSRRHSNRPSSSRTCSTRPPARSPRRCRSCATSATCRTTRSR
jgi:hypothetical protein